MSSRLFIDTNIVLDLLARRDPFYLPAAKLATLADYKKVELVTSPLTVATVNYLLTKYENARSAKEKIGKFLSLCQVCTMDEQTVEKAMHLEFSDFEDGLQYISALSANCNILITRNIKDYKKAAIPVMTAEEYLLAHQ